MAERTPSTWGQAKASRHISRATCIVDLNCGQQDLAISLPETGLTRLLHIFSDGPAQAESLKYRILSAPFNHVEIFIIVTMDCHEMTNFKQASSSVDRALPGNGKISDGHGGSALKALGSGSNAPSDQTSVKV